AGLRAGSVRNQPVICNQITGYNALTSGCVYSPNLRGHQRTAVLDIQGPFGQALPAQFVSLFVSGFLI
ncbi:hypothetical protein, partial [Immundisolibacter sp.]|uniref:hypothetical protein n=1 Tax=Immundisolibacter sp. TaxID=1934948 RepID=UPI003562A02E